MNKEELDFYRQIKNVDNLEVLTETLLNYTPFIETLIEKMLGRTIFKDKLYIHLKNDRRFKVR